MYCVTFYTHFTSEKGEQYHTDRQTDILLTGKKSIQMIYFVIEIREICTSIYNIVNLLKSYDNIHSMTYITKIMLTGIAIKNTGYYDNMNDCYLVQN